MDACPAKKSRFTRNGTYVPYASALKPEPTKTQIVKQRYSKLIPEKEKKHVVNESS